jgi:hypothetical protein
MDGYRSKRTAYCISARVVNQLNQTHALAPSSFALFFKNNLQPEAKAHVPHWVWILT